jgi:hypothetical protein
LGPDLKIDQLVDWIRFKSIKCGGPIGTWTIEVSGTRHPGGGLTYLLSGGGTATLAGSPTAASGPLTADFVIDVKGVPLSTGGEKAHWQGTADYAAGDVVLDGKVTGTSHGENPFAAATMSMFDSISRFTLTPTAGTYC